MQVNRPYGFGQGETISDSPLVEIVTPSEQTPSRGYNLSWGLFSHSLEEGQIITPGVYELTSLQQTEVGDSVYSFGEVITSDQIKLYGFSSNVDATLPNTVDINDELHYNVYLSQLKTGVEIMEHIVPRVTNVDTQQEVTLLKTTMEGSNNQHYLVFLNREQLPEVSVRVQSWNIIGEGTVDGDDTPANNFGIVCENYLSSEINVDFSWV